MQKQKMVATQGLETTKRAQDHFAGYTVRILHIDGKERRLNTLVAVKGAPKGEGIEKPQLHHASCEFCQLQQNSISFLQCMEPYALGSSV